MVIILNRTFSKSNHDRNRSLHTIWSWRQGKIRKSITSPKCRIFPRLLIPSNKKRLKKREWCQKEFTLSDIIQNSDCSYLNRHRNNPSKKTSLTFWVQIKVADILSLKGQRLSARDVTKIMTAYMRNPLPKIREKRVFTQLQALVHFFGEVILVYFQNKKVNSESSFRTHLLSDLENV